MYLSRMCSTDCEDILEISTENRPPLAETSQYRVPGWSIQGKK
jgi:hypothetical protein